MNPDFLQQLAEGYRRADASVGTLVVGVSAGLDSVALLRATVESFANRAIIVAHANHGLRGSESDGDQNFVEDLAKELQLPCVAKRLKATGGEAEFRNERYAFFTEVAWQHDSTLVAVAHHANDQAETVLHNMLRGTGLRGLSGMTVRRELNSSGIDLVRPMLKIDRAIVEAWMKSAGYSWREDASNAQPAFTRNRLRNTIMPLLKSDVNSLASEHLVELAAQADELSACVDLVCEQLLEGVTLEAQANSVRLSRGGLRNQPAALLRQVFVFLWRCQSWPRQSMSAEHWGAVARAVRDGGAMDLPGGVQLQVAEEMVRLIRR